MFTDAERALLRTLCSHIGAAIACPDYNIARLAEGTESGGGQGFRFRIGKTAITGQWHEWLLTGRDRHGRPTRWRHGRLLREATITYTRLHRWIDSLPASTRAQAVIHWRTAPVDTRDLPALERLTLTAIDDTAPATLFDLDTTTHQRLLQLADRP
ncbi:hypothetical protein [Nocardia suismassiliense]|uniref:hypothetical protein n=1 Tax=Nocardia suismassiliense TaxID=2077092 RepID=UPI000D1E9701|nr:hypothetical protein [Nocardia suismassiliense]